MWKQQVHSEGKISCSSFWPLLHPIVWSQPQLLRDGKTKLLWKVLSTQVQSTCIRWEELLRQQLPWMVLPLEKWWRELGGLGRTPSASIILDPLEQALVAAKYGASELSHSTNMHRTHWWNRNLPKYNLGMAKAALQLHVFLILLGGWGEHQHVLPTQAYSHPAWLLLVSEYMTMDHCFKDWGHVQLYTCVNSQSLLISNSWGRALLGQYIGHVDVHLHPPHTTRNSMQLQSSLSHSQIVAVTGEVSLDEWNKHWFEA